MRSIYGSPYKIFFRSGHPDPAGDLICSGIGRPTVRNYWWDIRDQWTFPYYSLNIVLGSGKGFYRNDRNFMRSLSSDHFFFNFPDTSCAYGPLKDELWGEIFVSFSGELFEFARRQGIFSADCPVWKTDNLGTQTEQLLEILQEPIPTTKRQTMRRAIHFLDFMVELLEQSHPAENSPSGNDWFAKACKMLTGNLHDPVDCHKIAENLGMSYHTFRAHFRQRAGIAPMQYRNKARMQQSCEYLVNNCHKPCREIAFELGFSDTNHFSKHFKRHMGMTPNKYRQKYKKR